MSGSPRLTLTLTLTLVLRLIGLAACSGSGLSRLTTTIIPISAASISSSSTTSPDGCYLRLILGRESCLGFIQVDLSNGGCCYRDLASRVENLVRRFKHVFVSIFIELLVAYVGPNIYGKLQRPDR